MIDKSCPKLTAKKYIKRNSQSYNQRKICIETQRTQQKTTKQKQTIEFKVEEVSEESIEVSNKRRKQTRMMMKRCL